MKSNSQSQIVKYPHPNPKYPIPNISRSPDIPITVLIPIPNIRIPNTRRAKLGDNRIPNPKYTIPDHGPDPDPEYPNPEYPPSKPPASTAEFTPLPRREVKA